MKIDDANLDFHTKEVCLNKALNTKRRTNNAHQVVAFIFGPAFGLPQNVFTLIDTQASA